MSLRKYFSSFENEAVSDIDSPRDYLHIKILRFTLVIISSWPQKELGEPEPYYQIVILKYFYLVFTIACQIGCVTYITLHMRELNFFEAGLGYLTALMDAENLFRVISLTLSTKYRNVVKDFLTKTHLFYYKNGSEYAMKIHKMVHILSHLFTLFVVGQMTMGLILFNLIPMYNNYAAGKYSRGGVQNATFEHSLYYSYPFNFSTDVTGYTVACIINWFISYLCTSWFCMFDLILTLMVFHIWGHFKILINLLNDFPRPSTSSNFTLENGCVIQADIYSKEELLQVSKRLKDCINYHRAIVHFTEAVSDVFGPMLFSYYLFHQASGCLLLLECSQMTVAALVRYLPLSIILTQQLIQLSVIFELVGSESGKLKDAVYGVPWECMDCANRKLVKFFLMNVQEPVHLKALGVANVGVTSMAMVGYSQKFKQSTETDESADSPTDATEELK